jgi:uncharacterized protein YndB with AHSA1/START domain
MLKKIGLAVLGLIVALVAVIALQPSEYRVTRTKRIAAPPEKVFEMVNDFHRWEAWSPWAKLDPAMKTTYEGPAAGAGSIYRWTGNDEVGEGMMTITSATPGEKLAIDLEFIKPFASKAKNEFVFRGQDGQTDVSWSMAGEADLMSKAFFLFTGGADRMIGADFEKGLSQMKAAAESSQN